MKKFKIVLIIFIIFLGVLVLVGNFFYEVAISSKTDKSSINNQESSSNEDYDVYDYVDINFFDENKVLIDNKSIVGVDLQGYKFVNSNSNKWVVVTHGYGSEAKKMAYYIRKFYNMGYNVFAPDLIGHGNSKGDFISMGGYDSYDIRNWIDILNKEYDFPPIALFGISMGATTVMNTLDKDLSDNVKLFIQDSGYVDLRDQIEYQLKKLYNLPQFPIIPVASLITKLRAGYFIEDVDVRQALMSTKLPALIMHGDIDSFVPLENANIAYELINSPKQIYISKDCKHVEGATKNAASYWLKISEFMAKYF